MPTVLANALNDEHFPSKIQLLANARGEPLRDPHGAIRMARRGCLQALLKDW
jgi:hypothetical protein